MTESEGDRAARRVLDSLTGAVAAAVVAELETLLDTLPEVARLRQWKAEAEEVLAAWEGVWMIAGQPWRRGETQAQAVAREVQRLRSEVAAWMNGVADVVEPLGYDRGAACGPADLLPGLTKLRVHDMEMTRRLSECVEARSLLYQQVAQLSRERHVD